MSLDGRLDSLKARHAELDKQIEEENKRPLPNDQQIASLKREKLKLKEELGTLQSHH